ncbi:MAG: hypothetical protein PG981_000276 [Wolbachia endosymbiont of Ctenocephalides orientis wCori]|nr:MAG: hypothetical protein PG981_000276 [Wolbachia endosymbiont of Ctenocephalides orientis wCori]
MHNPSEVITYIPGKSVISSTNPSNNTFVRPELLLEDDESWKKFFSGKIIKTEPTKHIHIVDDRCRYHANDENKYNGQRITTQFLRK